MTLLPDKHIPTKRSLVGIGSLLLERLETTSSVSSLWDEIKDEQTIGSFDNFVLALDYLYAIGAIDYEQGILTRTK